MKHFRTMLVGLGIGLGGVALGSLPGQPTLQAEGERHTVPVAVENTPTVNVRTLPAITGSVSITGQPVSVNVNTLPAVQLAPGTTVGVTGGSFSFSNTAGTPIFTRDKDNPALAPLQTTLCVYVTSRISPCGVTSSVFPVPVGTTFVIEFVSTACFSTATGWAEGALSLGTTVGGAFAQHRLPPGQQDIFGTIVANQQTRIYADAGTVIDLSASAQSTAQPGSAWCTVVLSGYLVTP